MLKLPAEAAYLGALADGSPPARGYAVRPPYRSLYSDRYETLLVRVVAEDGTAGWGEALAPVAPEVPAQVIDLLLAPVLIGSDALSPRPNWTMLRELMRERGHLVGHQADALAAVDIALWDLAGRLTGRRVVDLLGGAFREQVPTYVSGLPRPDDAGRAELAERWAADGATSVKLHLGNGVAADLATIDAVRSAAPGLRLAVDAHWAYSVDDALRLADGLAERGCWFLEAPLAPEDLTGHAELVSRARLPVAVGETLRSRFEFAQWLAARGLRIAQPDVARTGITEAVTVGELCSAQHVPVAPHHSVGLGISLAAGLHLSASIADLTAFEYQPTSVAVGERILAGPLAVEPHSMSLPTGPGLGVEIDAEAVAALAKES
ncbi:enolase superfamily enzyme related to L-alanine-DL-glutamate epimerase [Actinoalloteichus sp. GBA129-24]|nr:enolase superfamily enzyme related to L-alanine-DL-glutamate epimerase [Actinoalloteichus sp. GBA129-24]